MIWLIGSAVLGAVLTYALADRPCRKCGADKIPWRDGVACCPYCDLIPPFERDARNTK